ncbi:hypothetical protein ACL9RF_10110 [Sphingobacterium sp. Mn56C]|uniref:hypothetical protein n=1 Tax=Sphingobacterium sp. Mn56C TaxID=3395261 RepID=UPI003BD582A6
MKANRASVLSAIDAQIREDQSTLGNQGMSKEIDSAQLKKKNKAINSKRQVSL